MSTSYSRNGSKRENQENWIGNGQSNEEPEHDQQGKEQCASKKDLMRAKCFNCDQMGHYACDCTDRRRYLTKFTSNFYIASLFLFSVANPMLIVSLQLQTT